MISSLKTGKKKHKHIINSKHIHQ